MELPIHKVSLGGDGKAYVCFKVPPLTLLLVKASDKPRTVLPESEYITARFPAEAMETLVSLLKKEQSKRR